MIGAQVSADSRSIALASEAISQLETCGFHLHIQFSSLYSLDHQIQHTDQITCAGHFNGALALGRFISSRNSRLRVRLVTSSNPVVARLICFI